MSSITIRRPLAPIRARIDLPRSKSISNRALICAAFTGDLTCVNQLSDADDTRILHRLLTERPRVMNCGLGGTTFRFLLAWAAVQVGEEHIVTGEARLLERPHDDLLNALRSLGADIERTSEGYRVRGRKLKGGDVIFDSPISSQFISALMMIAPMMESGLRIVWKGRRLSEPYVRMTAKVMGHFGVKLHEQQDAIVIAPGPYRANALTVPPDWSAAAFWYEIAAISDGAHFTFPGLHSDGWQGDEGIMDILISWVRTRDDGSGTIIYSIENGPSPHPWPVYLGNSPDLFQPLVFSCAGTGCKLEFGGLDNLRAKESDRIATVVDALHQLRMHGEMQDGVFKLLWSIKNKMPLPFDPHGDHRMAMALAPLALVCERIMILDPDVVNKSYPRYWEDLEKAGFRLERS